MKLFSEPVTEFRNSVCRLMAELAAMRVCETWDERCFETAVEAYAASFGIDKGELPVLLDGIARIHQQMRTGV